MKTYGTGLLLCVGAHTNDSPHWALQLKYPSSVECLEQAGQTDDVWGEMNTLFFEYPRPNLPPVKAYWYDGVTENTDPSLKDEPGAMLAFVLNRPELAGQMEKEYKEDFPAEGGTLFVGEKGHPLLRHLSARRPASLPSEQVQGPPPAAAEIPRIPGGPGNVRQPGGLHAGVHRGRQPPCSNFPDVSGPYIEALLVGNLAMRAGVGKKLEWDGVNMKCTNMPELNQFVKPDTGPAGDCSVRSLRGARRAAGGPRRTTLPRRPRRSGCRPRRAWAAARQSRRRPTRADESPAASLPSTRAVGPR